MRSPLLPVIGALALAGLLVVDVASSDAGPEAARTPGALRSRRPQIEGASPGAEMRSAAFAGPFQPVAPGLDVPLRAELRTAASPLRFVLPDGTRVELAPESHALLLGPMEVVLEHGKVAPERIELLAGEIRIEAPAALKAGSVLVASREILVAPLPGAKVRVRADAKATPVGFGIAVDEGEARFATKGIWRPIARGQAVEALADQSAAKPSVLPAAPEWASAPGACGRWPAKAARAPVDCPVGIVTSDGEEAALALGWREVAGASSFTLEIARDAAFTDVLARRETAQRVSVIPLQAGSYFARVAARGIVKMPSLSSPVREIRVVRVELPRGTAVREGAWSVPRLGHLKLVDAAGTELALGDGGFSTAPAELGPLGDAPLMMRMRTRGAASFAELALAPSPLRATIRLTPRNATWPSDPIAVQVEVQDGGAPIPASFEPKLSVRVNSTEVAVEWWRRGNVWRAQLEPRVPPGPWVVRVEARDPHDNEIGAGFAEVAGPPPLPTPVASR